MKKIENYTDLSKYPIKKIRNNIKRWNKENQKKEIHYEGGYDVQDVSSFIGCFPHLTLDENYRLIMYTWMDIPHGRAGLVVALPKDAPLEIENFSNFTFFFSGLPKGMVDPMYVLYNDKTSHGYFETVIALDEINSLPWANVYSHRMEYIDTFPKDYDKWTQYVEVKNIKPKLIGRELIMFKLQLENGFETSDGRDILHCFRYVFNDIWPLFWDNKDKERFSEYIMDRSRYSNRGCCIVQPDSFAIAIEPSPFSLH